ncbi:hypothetical protein MHYP_G00355210 [Metynnis hypsauchen]
MLKRQHAEIAPPLQGDKECWYLPLFGVYHPKKPEKIRIVFDSSAAYDGVSLNDVLITGPDLNNSLVGLLMRFRKEAVAITADVEHMFHCFVVKEDHRDFLRFLWYQNNDMAKTYDLVNPAADSEIRPQVTANLMHIPEDTMQPKRFERFSKLSTLIRAIAHLIHIARTFSHSTLTSSCRSWHICQPSVEEKAQAKVCILKSVQKECYQEEIKMSTTVVPVENVKNGFTVISHVVPAQTTGNEQQRAAAVAGAPNFTRISAFLKGEPKALGTVQIMIGVMTFLFAIVLTVNISTSAAYSGICYWGAFIYISAGSLAVAAENKLHPCVVKGSLGMNVISAITAGIAIVLLSLDLVFGPINYGPCYPEYDHYFECHTALRLFQSRNNGITGVLLFFSLLQFIISICISAFGCKVICNDEVLEQAAVNMYAVPIPVSSIENSQLCSNMELPPEESPPAYTENAD